ncbi:MAG: urate hydroxylase PuuD, partial [Cyanobacteria bacterium REEB65]|nr:urate hydroxylase PuuD [Cyanobacteria bacterium REEB65]
KHILPNPSGGADVDGELWMVHSGGFYQVEKKFVRPEAFPQVLHWFKWEAGFTWLSGITLLALVYYLGGPAYMLDPAVSHLQLGVAVAMSIGLLLVGWLVYDALWNSPLGRRPKVAIPISLALLFAAAYGLTHALSGRAAYIHVGALLGTIMVANVWMRIIPFQRKMVAAAKRGEKPDFEFGVRAKLRSTHNHYLTYPVVFIMISNHFPMTYGAANSLAILTILFAAGMTIKWLLNQRERSAWWGWSSAATVAAAIGAVFLLSSHSSAGADVPVTYAQVHTIMQNRCMACHSAAPTDPQFPSAPLGIAFDQPQRVHDLAAKIRQMAVETHAMPLGNKTGMTLAERDMLGRWIDQGAKIP